MADYESALKVLFDAAQKEIEQIRLLPKAYFCARQLENALSQQGAIERRYATLCASISDAVDCLLEIPLAFGYAQTLLSALEQAEEIYIQTVPYIEDCAMGFEKTDMPSSVKRQSLKRSSAISFYR